VRGLIFSKFRCVSAGWRILTQIENIKKTPLSSEKAMSDIAYASLLSAGSGAVPEEV